MLLSLLNETYHILLSSITIMLYVKDLFESGDRWLTKTKYKTNQASKNRRRLNKGHVTEDTEGIHLRYR